MKQVFAQDAQSIVGSITNPLPAGMQNLEGSPGGPIMLMTNILRLVFVVAGVWAFINFIIAGFQYMSAAGDTKALNAAFSRIWQSLIGLAVIVASFALAALIGQVFFGSATAILSPKIYGPQ